MSWMPFPRRDFGYSIRRCTRLVISAVTAGIALAATAGLGVLAAVHRTYGLLAAALVALVGVVMVDPVLVPMAAFPATLLIQRAGGGVGSGVDLSDLVISAGAVVALTKIRWNAAPTLKRVLVPVAVFQALFILTVVAHPNSHDILEWAHRIEMLAGSLLVGWVVAVSGRARQAVSVLLVGCMVLALIVLGHAVALHFKPAQFGLYQKNFIGASMWEAVVIAHLNPSWLRVPQRLARSAKYLCALALLASQSKQAIIALVVVLAYTVIRQPSVRRRSKLLIATLVPVAITGYLLISAEVANLAVNKHNSIATRLQSFSADFHLWSTSPILGEGMRWFYLPQYAGYIQPPNIFVETLLDGGIVGVIALLILLGGSARVFFSLPREIGTIALVLVLGRVVESIFDIYWTSGGSVLPWLVAGLAIGVWDARLTGGIATRRRASTDALPTEGLATTGS